MLCLVLLFFFISISILKNCNRSSMLCPSGGLNWISPGTRVKSWRRSYHPTGLCKRHVACHKLQIVDHRHSPTSWSKVRHYQHMHRGVWSKNLRGSSNGLVNLKFHGFSFWNMMCTYLGAGFTSGGHWRWHWLRAAWLGSVSCHHHCITLLMLSSFRKSTQVPQYLGEWKMTCRER